MTKRVKLTVAYDGTDYHGWQLQNGQVTIESELNSAISDLCGEEIQVIGASRTDAGVHALCNVAVFDTGLRMPAEKISYALNQRLPEDIRVVNSAEVVGDFHPRKCESRKTYEYRIYNAEFPNPLKNRYSYFTYIPLNVKLMQEAAVFLVGEHDFKSFCSVNTQADTTVRTIYSVEVIGKKCEEGPFDDNSKFEKQDVTIRITGNGFLYNMVRIIAGTLMDVGSGKRKPEEIQDMLIALDRCAAGPTAPACGLTLVKYEYL